MTRILIASHVEPGPAVESSLLHVRDVVRHQVVAQPVALVHGGPKLAGLWRDGDAHRVADAVRVNALPAPIRVVGQDVRPVSLGGIAVRVVHVRGGADRHEHNASIARESYVARPMASSGGYAGDNRFASPASLHVAIRVWEPDQ